MDRSESVEAMRGLGEGGARVSSAASLAAGEFVPERGDFGDFGARGDDVDRGARLRRSILAEPKAKPVGKGRLVVKNPLGKWRLGLLLALAWQPVGYLRLVLNRSKLQQQLLRPLM
jgi:hypothetical protein